MATETEPESGHRNESRSPASTENVYAMTPREFLIAFGPRIAELARDAETMSATPFKRKHGIDVRECRAKIRRLKALAADGKGTDEEMRELVGLLAAVLARNKD